MPEEMDEGSPASRRRVAAAMRRANGDPRLVGPVRWFREQTLGEDDFVDRVSATRGRPADLAAQRLAALRGQERGFLGELGLSALQAWQRLSEAQDRGRGKVDVAILFTDLVGFSAWALEAGDRAVVALLAVDPRR